MTAAQALPLARRIARFAQAQGAALAGDAGARAVVLRCFVDGMACMLGARDAPPVAMARETACRFHAVSADVAGASLLGAPRPVDVESAAYANTLALRYLDYNDIYLSTEAVHPSDAIAAALAVAQACHADGERLLHALCASYEVHCRLADAVCTRKAGWDHVVLNTMASAVAAGVAMGQDESQLAEAIAIAATANIATLQTRTGELSIWKAAAAAYTARAGVFAVLQAHAGMTGPWQALEGKHGFLRQVGGAGCVEALDFASPGARLAGIHLKRYPIGYFTQPAVDAALQLRPDVRVEWIESILIETTAYGKLANADSPQKWTPRVRETADHSLPYGVAVALIDGRVGQAQFEVERITAADVQQLMQKIEVRENPGFSALYPAKVSTRITVAQRGREAVMCRIDHPRGHARNPMDANELDAKFRDVAPQASPDLPARLACIAECDARGLGELLAQVLA